MVKVSSEIWVNKRPGTFLELAENESTFETKQGFNLTQFIDLGMIKTNTKAKSAKINSTTEFFKLKII